MTSYKVSIANYVHCGPLMQIFLIHASLIIQRADDISRDVSSSS